LPDEEIASFQINLGTRQGIVKGLHRFIEGEGRRTGIRWPRLALNKLSNARKKGKEAYASEAIRIKRLNFRHFTSSVYLPPPLSFSIPNHVSFSLSYSLTIPLHIYSLLLLVARFLAPASSTATGTAGTTITGSTTSVTAGTTIVSCTTG
jgi:hypothetical protein